MKSRIKITIFFRLACLILISFLILPACSNYNNNLDNFPTLSGPYLGQTPPGDIPEIFAPGIINTGMQTRDIAMMPDGSEIYFCATTGKWNSIFFTKLQNGKWTKPDVAPFSGDAEIMDFEPFITPDGKKLYFLSNRIDAADGDEKIGDQDIWVVDRVGDGWSEPYNLGEPICTPAAEFFPSVTNDGTMYFTRNDPVTNNAEIHRSRLVNGKYQPTEKLPKEVNATKAQFNAFVSPDESYIIVPAGGNKDTFGGSDYYISFRNADDTWTGPINLGEKINTQSTREFSPYVSPDGKYFFFMSARYRKDTSLTENGLNFDIMKQLYLDPEGGNPNIYWVKADFLRDLNPNK